MAYLAACNLLPQTTNAILDVQAGTLIQSPAQASSQSWQLWNPGMAESSDLYIVVS